MFFFNFCDCYKKETKNWNQLEEEEKIEMDKKATRTYWNWWAIDFNHKIEMGKKEQKEETRATNWNR